VPAKPKTVDWAAVEADYRAGIKTLREIGKAAGVSHTAIALQAQKENWTRDLKSRIRAKAQEKLQRAVLPVTRLTEVTEAQVVEANATVQATITLEHRRDVKKARKIVWALMAELQAYCDFRDENVNFPVRVAASHKLADALAKLVTLERTVAGIEDTQSDESIVVSALKRMNERAAAERLLADGTV